MINDDKELIDYIKIITFNYGFIANLWSGSNTYSQQHIEM